MMVRRSERKQDVTNKGVLYAKLYTPNLYATSSLDECACGSIITSNGKATSLGS